MIKIKCNIETSLLSIITDNTFIDMFCVCGNKPTKMCIIASSTTLLSWDCEKIVEKICLSLFDNFNFNISV